MQKTELLAEILRLSPEDRMALVDEIWDSIAADPGSIQLTDAQRRELDSRLADTKAHPTNASPWREVSMRIRRHLS